MQKKKTLLNSMKNKRGITLIALIITIIVLLIFAGVTISLVLGDNGILNKAKLAEEEYTKATIKEKIELAIADIMTEEATKQNVIIMDIIVNRLPDKIDGLTVQKDGIEATGTFDGYEYIITKDFEATIGGKVGVIENIRLKVTRIGTTTCEVEVKITNPKVEKTGYEYYLNGIKLNTSLEGNTYTIQNLTPETEYTIYAVVVDIEGKQTQTNTVTIKTEPRTYLYHEGNENTDITGGWDYYTVASSGTIENRADHIYYQYQRGEAIGDNSSYAQVSIFTKNKIKLEGYTKICIDIENVTASREMELSTSRDNTAGNKKGAILAKYVERNTISPTQLVRKTYTFPLTQTSEDLYIYFFSLTNKNYGANYPEGKIYSIWLEK